MDWKLLENLGASARNDDLLFGPHSSTGNTTIWTIHQPHDWINNHDTLSYGVPYAGPGPMESPDVSLSEDMTPQDSCSSGDDQENTSKTHRGDLKRTRNKDSSAERRREQNRAAQRAYRQRKDDTIRDLETQVNAMKISHDELQTLCEQQRHEIAQLQTQMAKLVSNLQNVVQVSVANLKIIRAQKDAKESIE